MARKSPPIVNIYPFSNYKFVSEEAKIDKFTSIDDHLAHRKLNYENEGMRRTVEGILMVHEDNHPHILLLRFGDTTYKLPGGRLKRGEDEIEGLKRKLTSKLAGNSPASHPDWQIGECVDHWWRPDFDDVMYPCGPPFITEPKECKKRYMVHLSERECFAVPNNFKIHAVPLLELYDNDQKYGRVLASLPQHLSRFQLKLISP